MREARQGERKLTAVVKRDGEDCVGVIEVIVDKNWLPQGANVTNAIFVKLEEAVTAWLQEQAFARALLRTECGGDFNFGDLVLHLDGYSDTDPNKPAKHDLDRYMVQVGFRCIEVYAYCATDPEGGLWKYDDPLFDADEVDLEQEQESQDAAGGPAAGPDSDD